MGWGVQAALGQFDELMGEMSRRQITLGEKTKGGFREIVKRTTGRYEMLYGMDTGIFDASPGGRLGQVLEGSWLGEFLAATMGPDWRLMRQALLVSFPGAKEQQVTNSPPSGRLRFPCPLRLCKAGAQLADSRGFFCVGGSGTWTATT